MYHDSSSRFGMVTLAAGLTILAACASGGSGGGAGAGAPSIPSLPSPSVSPPSAPGVSPPSAPGAPSAPKPPATGEGRDQGRQAPDKGKPGGSEPTLNRARTAGERQADVAQEMDAALAEMDELLLKEKRILAQERPEAMSASGRSSGGGTAGQAGAPETGEGGAPPGGGANTTGASPSAATGSRNASTAPLDPGDQEAEDQRIPPDIPDGRGDDIVARQLREAAISEDDPVLRDKLWDEYRKYKSGQK